jgi:Mrp family chromosome partitioning ATPase
MTSIRDFEKKEKYIRITEIAKSIECSTFKNFNECIHGVTQPPFEMKDKPFYIIAFYAEKGGVGKTSNVSSIAHILSENHRVLLYDCDSQRSLSAFLLGLHYQD